MPPTRVTKLTPEEGNERNKQVRRERALLIVRDSFEVSPCDHCFYSVLPCIISTGKANCAECTKDGKSCRRELHSASDYQRLQQNEKKLDEDIDRIEEEQNRLHEELQRSMQKLLRLRKQRKFLKERGIRMLEHDAILDPGDTEPPTQSGVANPSLAATSEDVTLNQLLNLPGRDPFSPSFWNGVGSPSGGTVEPVGASPSSSR
ncbi:hypothetical protein BDV10DRAFT_190477 [Aspergillus recurvatus]